VGLVVASTIFAILLTGTFVLPGNNFIYIIMQSLVGATPGLKESIEVNSYPGPGLVLSDRSYWRANTVVGRVLGGLKGIKAT